LLLIQPQERALAAPERPGVPQFHDLKVEQVQGQVQVQVRVVAAHLMLTAPWTLMRTDMEHLVVHLRWPLMSAGAWVHLQAYLVHALPHCLVLALPTNGRPHDDRRNKCMGCSHSCMCILAFSNA